MSGKIELQLIAFQPGVAPKSSAGSTHHGTSDVMEVNCCFCGCGNTMVEKSIAKTSLIHWKIGNFFSATGVVLPWHQKQCDFISVTMEVLWY